MQHNLELAEVEIVHVRRRINMSQLPVDIKRVQVRMHRSRQPLRRHRLNNIAGKNVLFERSDEAFIAFRTVV
jgi:hypothetical protein